jgi:tRNA(Ile)-lysidine synthase
MKKTIQKYIKSNILFSPSDKIIVGVSGGADSVALLDVLLSLGYKCIVAHCNFHLRKEESIRDEIFVRELSQTYNCTFHKIDFQTKEYALEKKISIEMAARELRYDWFEEIRKKEKANCIAIAHHKDDIVETLLMNLTRGTGVNGLTGIKAKKGYIVSPMLCVCKKDVLNYLNEKGLSYMYDSSNGECDFTRNKFRNIIIPMFESINPSFKESIIETTQILNDVGKIYQEYLNKKIENIVQQKDETTYISIENLKKEPIIKKSAFRNIKELWI